MAATKAELSVACQDAVWKLCKEARHITDEAGEAWVEPQLGRAYGRFHCGLALYHREQLDVSFTPVFLKAVLEYPLTGQRGR